MIQLVSTTFDRLRWWEQLLERYLSRVKLPANHEPIFRNPSRYLVVTQSSSFIFRALISAFAKRSGLRGARYFDGVPGAAGDACGDGSSVSGAGVLRWVSIHDTAALQRLLALSGACDYGAPFELVTLNIFERRGPIRSNPQAQLGVWRHISLLLLARRLTIVLGTPLVWSTLHASSIQRLVRSLKVDFYRNLKLVRGTPFQAIEAQARTLLHGAEFEREVGLIAQRAKLSKQEIRAQAEAEFYAIAANPRRTLFAVVSRLTYFFMRRLFTDILVRGLDSLSEATKEHTVIIVPMHRSHLDYILVGTALYHANVNSPVVAAGINLNFWPFGFFIRSVGGYFVRRNARQDRIHAVVLRRYVSYLVKRGHLHEFFIEGGRSRSGRMRPPRLGLLSIIMSAYLRGEKKEIVFMPVSITYENVIEDSVFGEENTGRAKREENLRSLFAAREFLRRRYGEVILHFGKPMPLSAYVAGARLNLSGKLDERALIHQVAADLTARIRSQTNPSFTSLAYTALMMAPGYGLSRKQLIAAICGLGDIADLMRQQDSFIGEPSPTLSAFLAGKHALLDELPRGGIVSRRALGAEDIFYLPGAKRFTADFYRNATIHLFLPAALLAINQVVTGSVRGDTALRLHSFLESDFLLPSRAPFAAALEALERALLERGALRPCGSSNELRFTEDRQELFVPAVLLATIQSYLWVLKNLASATTTEGPAEELSSTPFLPVTVRYSEFLKQLQDEFKTGVYIRYVTRTEAASRSALEGALESLQRLGFVSLREHQGKLRDIIVNRSVASELQFFEGVNQAILRWKSGPGPEALVR